MRSIPRCEQETVVRFDAEALIAYIDSATPATIRKLDRLCEQFPGTYKCVRVDNEYFAKRYEVPVSFIRFGKPLSEAQLIQRRAQSAVHGFKAKPA